MRRAERKKAEREKRTQRTLVEIDYLLQVDDRIRQELYDFEKRGQPSFWLTDILQSLHWSNCQNCFRRLTMSSPIPILMKIYACS